MLASPETMHEQSLVEKHLSRAEIGLSQSAVLQTEVCIPIE